MALIGIEPEACRVERLTLISHAIPRKPGPGRQNTVPRSPHDRANGSDGSVPVRPFRRLSLLDPLVARPMKGASQRTKGRTMRSDRIVRPHVLFLTLNFV